MGIDHRPTLPHPPGAMLELRSISYSPSEDATPILREASLKVEPGTFLAIVGPSGCGKTTLMKIIAGIHVETEGEVHWNGVNLSADDGPELDPADLGYVPQFSIAYDPLTVLESVHTAARLRVWTPDDVHLDLRVTEVLRQTGLDALRDTPVRVLSGGQKRRLGLAMELVSDPSLLLCDEVTSGLDPQAETEIVALLHSLSRQHGRIVIHVTHSLAHLDLYDAVLALHQGRVIYHGPPDSLAYYFSADRPEEVYERFTSRPADEWHASLEKRRDTLFTAIARSREKKGESLPVPPAPEERPVRLNPGFLSQFFTLIHRRLRLFFRDRTQLLLHLALLIGFPLLVVIFAPDGVGQMPKRLGFSEIKTAGDYDTQTRLIEKQVNSGGLISGLVMFQVVLLALMGSNNSAREIAGERLIFEKEKLAGLSPGAYLASKTAFLTALVAAQSLWMGLFVHHFCNLPGSFSLQLLLLLLVNAALTSVCLGISSLVRSPEQSSLLSIYLVGFQLPLSGAVLKLPAALAPITRPLIAAYWAWAGQLDTMRTTDFFIGIQAAVPAPLTHDAALCLLVLALHLAAGLTAAWIGCRKSLWD